MTNIFGAASFCLVASLVACHADDRARSAEQAAESSARANKILVTVICGELQRVDTRWDVTTKIVKANGESCTAFIDVPPGSTAAEIAASIASAIEAVCEVEATVTTDSTVSRSIELTNATFDDIRLRKYGTELLRSPEGDLRVYHKNLVPIDEQLTIKKVP